MLWLAASIAIRLAALAWSVVLLQRNRDWRMGFLSGMLALMAARQSLTLASGAYTGHVLTELPGLVVSVLAFLAVYFLDRVLADQRRVQRELEAREAELVQSQKMEAVGQLAGGVAHDFNNHLTVILGYAEELLMDLPKDDPLHAKVASIAEAAERSATLSRQLLAFSRRQPMKPQAIDLNRLIAELDRMLRRVIGDDVELRTLCAPDLELTLADPAQIEQVVLNLVVNARDAMPDGGSLTIETGNVEVEPGRAEVPPGRYVMLAVQDSGVGISEADRPRIFEPFFTTKQNGGTGLGLATAYGVVRQSGGAIDVTSQPGRGTTFKVLLPRVEAAATAPSPRREAPRGALEGDETLLLVEDSDVVRGYLRTALEQHGYRVIEAGDGEEALARADAAQPPAALVLTDVMMPRLGGVELGRRLAERHPSLPVVYMSGYAEGGSTGALEEAGVLLRKPFTVREMLSTVRRILDEDAGAPRP